MQIMQYRVTLKSCQQSFIVQSRESILDAAIREGLALNYGCSNGVCGLCKAQLVSGSTQVIRHHDHAIPEAQRLQGCILLCANTCKEDCVIDARIADQAVDIPCQEIPVRIRKIESLEDTILRIVVQTPRTQRLRFLAGQYARLAFPSGESREAGIASCPCDDRLIEFHLRLSDADNFDKQLRTRARVGETLTLSGPYGQFVYDDHSERSVLFIAFDTGFASVKSMLEHVTAQDKERSLHLIRVVCHSKDLYLRNLCRSWRDALDGFDYSELSFDQRQEDIGKDVLLSEKLSEVIREKGDLSHSDIYMVLPHGMIDTCVKTCEALGASRDRISIEPIRGNISDYCL